MVYDNTEIGRLDKIQTGKQSISFSNFSGSGTPQLKQGSIAAVGTTLFVANSDEAIDAASWAAIATSNVVYVYIVPAGTTASLIFSTTAPTWSDALQGWYNGSDKAVMGLYKAGSSSYQGKYIIRQEPDFFNKGRLDSVQDLDSEFVSLVLPFTFSGASPSVTLGFKIYKAMSAYFLTQITSAVSSQYRRTNLTLSIYQTGYGDIYTDSTVRVISAFSEYDRGFFLGPGKYKITMTGSRLFAASAETFNLSIVSSGCLGAVYPVGPSISESWTPV